MRDLNDEDLRELLWSRPPRRWPVLVSGAALGLLAFGAHLLGIGLGLSQTQQTDEGARSWQAEAIAQVSDTSWIPTGYRDISGDGTAAYQILTPRDRSCNARNSSCIGYRIVTRDGCQSGFWMRVNVLNARGMKISEGWAIGPPVWPGEAAEVTVAWDGPTGARYDIYDFQCRWSNSS